MNWWDVPRSADSPSTWTRTCSPATAAGPGCDRPTPRLRARPGAKDGAAMTRTPRRPGTTLMEVMIAMAILSIGLLAIMALFPIGAVNMARAINQNRAAEHATNSDALFRYYWKQAWLDAERRRAAGIGRHLPTGPTASPSRGPVEPMMLVARPVPPVTTPATWCSSRRPPASRASRSWWTRSGSDRKPGRPRPSSVDYVASNNHSRGGPPSRQRRSRRPTPTSRGPRSAIRRCWTSSPTTGTASRRP